MTTFTAEQVEALIAVRTKMVEYDQQAMAAKAAAYFRCVVILDEIIHSGSCSIYPLHADEARKALAEAHYPPVDEPK